MKGEKTVVSVAARIRNMLDINGWENIPVATNKTAPVSDLTCEMCHSEHPAVGYVVWRTETEPDEPDTFREEDLRVCYDTILDALDVASNDPGFVSAHVETFE